jgi:hypothetical protein
MPDCKIRFQLFYTAHWLTFFRAKDAVWPPLTSLTTMRFLWMLFTAIGMKCPSVSGPSKRVSFRRITPFKVVPDTTVPTPCVKQEIAQFNYMAILSTDTTAWCEGRHPMIETAILQKPCLPTRGEEKKHEPGVSVGSKVKRAENQILNDHSIRVRAFLSVVLKHHSSPLCKILVTSSEELFTLTVLKY